MNPNTYKNTYDVLTEAYNEKERRIKPNKPFKLDHSPLSTFYIVLGIGWTIFMIFLFLISKEKENVFNSIVYGVITPSTALILLGLLAKIFYIKFNEDEIIYRNCIGIKKIIKYKDIAYALRTDNNALELHSNNKKLLTINLTTFGHKRIIKFITNKNIKLKEQSNINNFIIQATKGTKIGLGIVSIFFASMGLPIAFINYSNNPTPPLEDKLIAWFSIILFGLIGTAIYLFSTKTKYLVTKNEIICKSFLKKDKVLKLNEIIGYKKRREEMQIYETYYLFDKDYNSIKILMNPNYTNIRLFKDLVQKKEWPKIRN